MADKGTEQAACGEARSACIHTNQIVDSCLDKDCIDELRERVSLLIAENNKLRIQLGGKGVRLLPGLK